MTPQLEFSAAVVSGAMGPEWMTAEEVCARLVSDPEKCEVDRVRTILRNLGRRGLVEGRESPRHVHLRKEWRLAVPTC